MSRRRCILTLTVFVFVFANVLNLVFPAFTSRFSVADDGFDLASLLNTDYWDSLVFNDSGSSLSNSTSMERTNKTGSDLQLERTGKSLVNESTVSNGKVSTGNPREKSSSDRNITLHTAIVGFPKCGTSSLLAYLRGHPEMRWSKRERCELCDGKEESLIPLMSEELGTGEFKYGIKCPRLLETTEAMEKLSSRFPDTRMIIGLRHPVLWYVRRRFPSPSHAQLSQAIQIQV